MGRETVQGATASQFQETAYTFATVCTGPLTQVTLLLPPHDVSRASLPQLTFLPPPNTVFMAALPQFTFLFAPQCVQGLSASGHLPAPLQFVKSLSASGHPPAPFTQCVQGFSASGPLLLPSHSVSMASLPRVTFLFPPQCVQGLSASGHLPGQSLCSNLSFGSCRLGKEQLGTLIQKPVLGRECNLGSF